MKRINTYFAAAFVIVVLTAGTVACDVPNSPGTRNFNPVFLLIDSFGKTYHTNPECESIRNEAEADSRETQSMTVDEAQEMGVMPCTSCSGVQASNM